MCLPLDAAAPRIVREKRGGIRWGYRTSGSTAVVVVVSPRGGLLADQAGNRAALATGALIVAWSS